MPTFEFVSTVRSIIEAKNVDKAREILEVDLADACYSIESIEEVR